MNRILPRTALVAGIGRYPGSCAAGSLIVDDVTASKVQAGPPVTGFLVIQSIERPSAN